jgi:acetoin utilization deacetylase AcuC-like enzyme
VPIAVKKLWEERPDLPVMIIDLDAHQGNGNAAIFEDDPRVSIFDVFNGHIYPGDYEAAQYVEYNHPVKMYIGDGEYMGLLERELRAAIDESAPGLIIYNAGTDVLKGDMLGGMSITAEGIIERDELVFTCTLERKTPILMLLSGGYTRRSAKIIGRSIENILTEFIVRSYIQTEEQNIRSSEDQQFPTSQFYIFLFCRTSEFRMLGCFLMFPVSLLSDVLNFCGSVVLVFHSAFRLPHCKVIVSSTILCNPPAVSLPFSGP